MSFAAPWLSPDPNETLLYSNPEPTDWLYLFPAHNASTSSPLQDISHSHRINVGCEPETHQNTAYSQETQLNHGSTPPRSVLTQHFTPSMSRVLRGDSFARLPTLNFTPSPPLPGPGFPDISDIGSQEPSSKFHTSPAPLASSSFSASQDSYDLNVSPLASLFYAGSQSTLGSFQSDVSPIVRCSQDQQMAPSPPKLEEYREAHQQPKAKKGMSTFVDDLISVRNTLVDGSAPSRPPVSGLAPPLLSPCKLTSSRDHVRPTLPSIARSGQDFGLESMEAAAVATLTLKLPFLQRSNAALPSNSAPSGPSRPSRNKNLRPRTLKRFLEEDEKPTPPSKKRRTGAVATKPAIPQNSAAPATSGSVSTCVQVPPQFKYGKRIFPASVEVSPLYPLFYRWFPVSSYFQPEDASSPCTLFKVSHPGGTYNPPRSAFDLYTPRFVKGKGADKVGLCPICIEPIARGGEGKKVWLAMKFSAFNYHLQNYHGISAASGSPFSPPLAFRIVARKTPGKLEKSHIREGQCHKCTKWIPVVGVKECEAKVPEIYWWKHAAACHKQTTIPGEKGIWEEDTVYKTLLEIQCLGSA